MTSGDDLGPGKELTRGAVTGQANGISLSGDGKRVAFRRTAQSATRLWVQDFARGQDVRVTAPPLSPSSALLSPDGQRVAFVRAGGGAPIYISNVRDPPSEQPVLLRAV